VLLAVALAAGPSCSYRETLDRLAPDEEVEFARAYLDHLRAGRWDEIERPLAPALLGAETLSKLEEISGCFPRGEPRSVELIGASVAKGPDWSSTNLSFQYEFDDAWVAASVALKRQGGGPLVVAGVNVNRLPASLQRIHAFTLRGKGVGHFLFLLLALLVVAVVITTLAVCVRAGDVRRKVAWAAFILSGVTAVSLNWTTGDVAFVPLTVNVPGVRAASAGPYAPWFVSVSFPLGAVLFLATRLRRRGPPAVTSPPSPPPAAWAPPGSGLP
jgi:hypothetical protein